MALELHAAAEVDDRVVEAPLLHVRGQFTPQLAIGGALLLAVFEVLVHGLPRRAVAAPHVHAEVQKSGTYLLALGNRERTRLATHRHGTDRGRRRALYEITSVHNYFDLFLVLHVCCLLMPYPSNDDQPIHYSLFTITYSLMVEVGGVEPPSETALAKHLRV